jgi:hypothetical protein
MGRMSEPDAFRLARDELTEGQFFPCGMCGAVAGPRHTKNCVRVFERMKSIARYSARDYVKEQT